MEIGRITSISVTCKDCKKVFVMGRGEVRWYSNRGYPLPKRCPECRKKRRKERENVKKQMPMPVNLNDCLLLWQMGYRTEVNDGRIVTVAKEPRKRKTA